MSDGSSETLDDVTEGTRAAGEPPPRDEDEGTSYGLMPRRGELVGRYLVLDRIGAGAMGVVLAAYDPELDRKVALKILKPRGATAGIAQARLTREAQALARVNHSNVVAVHDVGLLDGGVRIFVAMEFVEGRTLGQWLEGARARGGLGWRAVLEVFLAAGEGLAAAHAQGLVHRDFKPDNVMVGDDGRVRVMDFGLARAAMATDAEAAAAEQERSGEVVELSALDTPLTRTGAMMGTPAYMAPEQFAGIEVTARSDQFGFCVALFEALYGERPFAGDTLGALAMAVTEGRIVTPGGRARDRAARPPAWLDHIVRRGLAASPEHRHPEMRALLSALRAGETGVRRRRWVALSLGAAALLGAGTGAQAWHHRGLVAQCEREGQAIEEDWNPELRARLEGAFAASPLPMAAVTAERLFPWLDRQAEAWADARSEACLATKVEARWSAETLAKSRWCLEDRRLELQTLVDALAEADPARLRNAVEAAAGLAPVAPCVDPEQLARQPPPPDREEDDGLLGLRRDLATLNYLEGAGEYDEALALSEALRDRAEASPWPPIRARARLAHASLLERKDRFEPALELATSAYEEAARWNAWDLAATASLELAFLLSEDLGRHDEARTWGMHARVAIAHAGDPLGLREADRLATLGLVEQRDGRLTQARAHYTAALALEEAAMGADHPRLARTLNGLGHTLGGLGAYDESEAHYRRAMSIYSEALGPEHPAIATVYQNLGLLISWTAETDRAESLLEEARERYRAALGPHSLSEQNVMLNLGLLHNRVGRNDESVRVLEAALAMEDGRSPGDPSRRATLLGALARAETGLGRHAEADARFAAAAAAYRAAGSSPYPGLAATLMGHGDLLSSLERFDEASAALEEALGYMVEAVGESHANVAAARTNLAINHAARGDRAAARREFELALSVYGAALGDDHPDLSYVHLGLGALLFELGELAPARAHLERAWTLRTEHEMGPVARGEVALALGQLLWQAPAGAGRDRARARELIERADQEFRQVPDYENNRAELDTWLTRVR